LITIGITGGVGCGKSSVLDYIAGNYNCVIVIADDIGNKVKEPGQACFDELVELMGKDVLGDDGYIDKKKMADKIFADPVLLEKANNIIHPAVKEYILKLKAEEMKKGEKDYFFIEAALLIECGYRAYTDELWYIYAPEDVRRKRLRDSRGYSDEKIDRIIGAQLDEENFKKGCDRMIDNSGNLKATYRQIDRFLKSAGESIGK